MELGAEKSDAVSSWAWRELGHLLQGQRHLSASHQTYDATKLCLPLLEALILVPARTGDTGCMMAENHP